MSADLKLKTKTYTIRQKETFSIHKDKNSSPPTLLPANWPCSVFIVGDGTLMFVKLIETNYLSMECFMEKKEKFLLALLCSLLQSAAIFIRLCAFRMLWFSPRLHFQGRHALDCGLTINRKYFYKRLIR